MTLRSAVGSASDEPSGAARIERTSDVIRYPFRAMGTEMFLIGPEGARGFGRASARVQAIFRLLEQRFSRFRPESELSLVNRHAGTWVTVSEEFADLLAAALEGARLSGGLFDPTVLPALIAAGYDRDFRELASEDRGRTEVAPGQVADEAPTGRWDDVRLDAGRVFVPEGVALDLGGIAKGWAADRAVGSVGDLPWVVVDAGGDLRIGGTPPEGGLDIAAEDPIAAGSEVVRLKLSSGGLATSSITRRAWGPRMHHIIDPRTGWPAITHVLQATAWAPTCAVAEVRATWALLAGPAILETLPAILFMDGGEVRLNLERLPARTLD